MNIRSMKNRLIDLTRELSQTTERVASLKKEIKSIKEKIRKEEGDIRVTDHALLRYAEFVGQFSSDDFKQDLLKRIGDQVKALGGNGKFPIGAGGRAVVKDHTVVTIEFKGKHQ